MGLTIVVSVKAVVPYVNVIRLDPKTRSIIREGVPTMLNPADKVAVEFALKLKERFGGRVITLSMAPPIGKEALESLIGMGVDEAYLLSDRAFANADTLATSYVIANAVRRLIPKFDILIFGEESLDAATAHVPAQVAALLDIPYLYYVIDIKEIDMTSGKAVITRVINDEGVYETYEAKLPISISIHKHAVRPRDESLIRKIDAKLKGVVRIIDNSALNLNPGCIGAAGSPTVVTGLHEMKLPPRKRQLFKGNAREAAKWLFDNLIKEGVIDA